MQRLYVEITRQRPRPCKRASPGARSVSPNRPPSATTPAGSHQQVECHRVGWAGSRRLQVANPWGQASCIRQCDRKLLTTPLASTNALQTVSPPTLFQQLPTPSVLPNLGVILSAKKAHFTYASGAPPTPLSVRRSVSLSQHVSQVWFFHKRSFFFTSSIAKFVLKK